MKTFTRFFFASFFLSASLCQAQTMGPNFPGHTENQPLASCSSCTGAIWNNTDKVNAADNVYAFAQLGANGICFQSWCSRSRYLTCDDFGFNIPLNAQIEGIVLSIKSKCDIPGTVLDCTIVMKKNFSPTGTNFASAADWDTTLQLRIYGSPIELWGLTWTPQEINDANFGTYIKAYNTSSLTPTVLIDVVQITVYYNIGNAVHSQTSTPHYLSVWYDNDHDKFQIRLNDQFEDGVFQVTDLNGRTCFEEKIYANSTNTFSCDISASNLKTGLYMCTFTSSTQFYSSKVLLIK